MASGQGDARRREPATAEIGPSFDFYAKSPLGLADITTFDLDDSKSRLLVVSVGYRYLPTPNTAPTNRFEPFFILNYPIAKLGLLMSDRNRADLGIGTAETSHDVIAIASNSSEPSGSSDTTRPPTRAPNSTIPANTASGATRRFTPDVCFPSASMSSSTRITSTRTGRARAPISSTTSSD